MTEGQQYKKKKSVANTINDNLSNQISSKRQKFNEKSVLPHPICKGKSVLDNNTEQTDVDQALEIHFEEEFFINILSRLPVQSLVQLKCVSKFWKTLISDPYFKMKHLSHAKNDPNSQKFLLAKIPLINMICISFVVLYRRLNWLRMNKNLIAL